MSTDRAESTGGLLFPAGARAPLRVAIEGKAHSEWCAHARESPGVEICGVFVGQVGEDGEGPFVQVRAAIRGAAATEGSTRVTFTHATWNAIHQTIERDYPTQRIVGWYHSHPRFGVQFSELDLFVHRNFFSGLTQIAAVTDPSNGAIAICWHGPHGIEYLPRYWVDGAEHPGAVPSPEENAASPVETADGVIRITKEEALAPQVGDLLKRQMSLRGEEGVTRDAGGKWYYRSWFVLMLLGMAGALTAWGLLEPSLEDRTYFQGTISAIKADEPAPTALMRRFQSITLNGEEVFVTEATREIGPGGAHPRLLPAQLNVGDRIGVYLERYSNGDLEREIAEFLVRNPPPQPREQAALTIVQLRTRGDRASLLLFPLVAGMVGLFVGAGEGLSSRLLRRAMLCGGVGFAIGFVGGFISSLFANLIYAPFTLLASSLRDGSELTAIGFLIQVIGRSLAWGLAGLAMGLGQGVALRSKRLLLYGVIGGVIGGILGGLLFDPIDRVIGSNTPSGHWSRLVGFAAIGLAVGSMIGIVELLARDAWLRMTRGPLAGKEFLIFKEVMNVGASRRSDIYLFNDASVAPQHAIIRSIGDECDIEALHPDHPVRINGRAAKRARLRHGDQVAIGSTVFVFQQRQS